MNLPLNNADNISLEQNFSDTLNSILAVDFPNKVAVAVSGGVDSMALLHLISYWQLTLQNKGGNIEIHILHVNHGLRKESIEEEKFVQNISLSKGYKYKCYHWDSGALEYSIQEKARKARYDFMGEYCQQNNIRVLVTGHHKNDAIENYIFRKERGSSNLGLSTSYQSYRNDIRIIRPLCCYYKQELITYMEKDGHSWYEDSSNSDQKYSRNRIRYDLSFLEEVKIKKLEQEININDVKSQRTEEKLIEALAENVKIETYGVGQINLTGFCKLENEIQVPLLSHILTIISGGKQIPRYRNLTTIIDLIENDSDINHTMHGCHLVKNDANLNIYREKAKINSTSRELKNALIWDERFQLAIENKSSIKLKDYSICSMNPSDLIYLKEQGALEIKNTKFDDFEPRKLLFTFPVIKKVEKIVAVPHIFYYDDDNLKGNLKVIFRPNFVSRFTHFQNYSKVKINE